MFKDFVAPDARVLVVDDNEMNCDFMLALLEPLHIKTDVAYNGKAAIEMLCDNKYHIVFMDYIMPVMSGAEAVSIIRNMSGEYYKNVPIIVLSGSDSDDVKENLRHLGITDFWAKPVDLDKLYESIYNLLPKELIEDLLPQCKVGIVAKEKVALDIENIDVNEGIKNTGSIELLKRMLKDFYKLIDTKSQKIEKCLADYLIKDYTIEVHALKNTARMIGAIELSGMFGELEKFGNANDVDMILIKTPKVLEFYRRYKEYLKSFACISGNKREADKAEIIMYIKGIKDAVGRFDIDMADEAMACLEECYLPKECDILMEQLRVFIADVAMEDIIRLTEHMIGIMEV